jgi:signal transduction histidine kinase/CheY-like chemotaxis protein
VTLPPADREQPTVRWLPFVVLALSLLLTAIAVYHILTTSEAKDRLRFQNLVQKIQPIIQNRMEIYIALLRATGGLFAVEEEVDAERFYSFVGHLKVRERYPGVQGIAFSRRIAPGEEEAVATAMRRQGQPGFHVWPARLLSPDHPETHAILYLEPLDERNQQAIGYDMSTEAKRRAAMELARDTGRTAASGRLTLVQESGRTKQAGFVVYVPVYRRGAPLGTVAERRAALLGFVCSAFRAVDLLHGILGTEAAPTVSFELFAGPEPARESLLFRSHNAQRSAGAENPVFTKLSRFDLASSVWTLRFTTLPGFAAASGRDQTTLVLLLGLLTSAILFLVTRSEVQARLAAERVALDLNRSQEELRAERERYRRLAEAEHQARGEAETASQAKDRFLAALSHELRTPLTPVLAVISSLETRGGLADGVREGLGVIRRNVELEARLIDDLLDLTRIVQSKLELRSEIADLRTILEHALDACCPPGSSLRARFAIEADAGDHRLWADAPRLTQVFWNLFKNALKFSPDGGLIRVRTRRDESAGRLTVEVTDRGIGIEPERLGQVFDAFEQGQRSITRRYGGLGLGLTISKSIVELHGGRLSASSEGSGKGATFTVELPVGPVGADQPPATLPAAGGGDSAEARPLHILLVEDHADTADAMSVLLSAIGHRVTVAGDGEGALLEAERAAEKAAGEGGIDLVISDVGLPGMSGLELMVELRRRFTFPGIALSGYGMDEDVERSIEAGFSQHLTKPVSLPHLKAAIGMVTSGKEIHGSRRPA